MTAALRNTASALVAATVLAGSWAAPAGAAQVRLRTLCRRAQVVEQPRGLVVGYLARGTVVIVLKRTDNGFWTRVRSPQAIVGWIRTSSFC
jgi:ABC-type sugar transport system substrate-binding protein